MGTAQTCILGAADVAHSLLKWGACCKAGWSNPLLIGAFLPFATAPRWVGLSS